MSDPKLDEAVRIVRVVIEKLQMAGDAHLNISAIDALETVLAALSRRSEEWAAVVTALGPHAHPGQSPSESVAYVVARLAEARARSESLDEQLGGAADLIVRELDRADKAEAALAEAQAQAAARYAAEAERDTAEREAQQRDLADMRKFQQLYMEADHALRDERERSRELRAEVELEQVRVRVLGDDVYKLAERAEKAEAALAAERERARKQQGMCDRREEEFRTERERSERLREALMDLVRGAAVTFSDERIGYEEIQVNRGALNCARAALAPAQPEAGRSTDFAGAVARLQSAILAWSPYPGWAKGYTPDPSDVRVVLDAALAPAQPEEPNGRGEDGPVQPLTGWGYDTETGEEGQP